MILSSAYKFKKIANKSKVRMDCVASTKDYEDFEAKRAPKDIKETATRNATRKGALVVYYSETPDAFKSSTQRKPDRSLLIRGTNLSGIYIPDLESDYAFGDVYNTSDALLFIHKNFGITNGRVNENSELIILVARGKKHEQLALYNELADGALDEEIDLLLSRTIDE